MKIESESNAGKVFGRAPLVGMLIMVVILGGLVADVNKPDTSNFYADIIRLDNVTTRIHQNYVEAINSKDLVDKAIGGMLEILDPHTTYFEKKQYEELRIHTAGKFGGLGIQISIRDNVLTVMTPISGTPASRAGIQSGDQIIKINKKSTKGMSIDAAVSILRGEPGSEVTVTIRRKGESKDNDYTLTREIIRIKSVPFYGLLENNIGYVQLTTFSEDAGFELEKALKDMIGKGMKSVVFDLRSNPGGLLPQAVEVSEKFLPRKSLVVSTRGRMRGQNKEEYSSSVPTIPVEMPVVVLVDYASASASEIVSGAIQDWDRGVILGDTTFGKGSVQSILPLDDAHHLKLTTAFYYTPSGRCINKPENGVRGMKKAVEQDAEIDSAADSTASADSVAGTSKTDTTTYRTKGGRIVHGSGGIVPDTIVPETWPPLLVRELIAKDIFFKFANSEYPRLKQLKTVIDKSYQPDARVVKEFYAYIDSIQFKFTTAAHLKFDEFKQHAGLEDSSVITKRADSLKTAKLGTKGAPASIAKVLADDLDLKLTPQERQSMLNASKQIDDLLASIGKRSLIEQDTAIKKRIAEAVMIRELGQDNEIIFRYHLNQDRQLRCAMNILQDKKTYDRLLKVVGKH